MSADREVVKTHPGRRYDAGCRCESCVALHNDRIRRSRRSRLATGSLSHGTRSAYDAGCRCDPCRAARREAYRRLREYARAQEMAGDL